MLRLIDNVSNERLQGSRTTIKAIVYKRFTQYKKQGLLKGYSGARAIAAGRKFYYTTL